MIRSLLVWLLLVSCNNLYAQALPKASDLQKDAAALMPNQVLLLMVSQHSCSYCTVIREEFLLPMQRNEETRQKVMIRELKIDQASSVVDFDGTQRSASHIAARYAANLAPTLLLLDDKGTLLVPKLVGISTPEFYGYYLDSAIEEARQIKSN